MTDLKLATEDELTLMLVAGTDEVRDKAVREIRRREVERCVAALVRLNSIPAASRLYVSLDHAINTLRGLS